jgi:hypothetical protein
MKGDVQLLQSYTQRLTESLIARLKNLGEAQETVDEFRKGKVLRDRT